MTAEQLVLRINELDQDDTSSAGYREWDNYMYRIHVVARNLRDSKIMMIVGRAQSNRKVDSLDAIRVVDFANKNKITY